MHHGHGIFSKSLKNIFPLVVKLKLFIPLQNTVFFDKIMDTFALFPLMNALLGDDWVHVCLPLYIYDIIEWHARRFLQKKVRVFVCVRWNSRALKWQRRAASIRMRGALSAENPRRPWARYQIFIMHLLALERLFINNSIKSNNSHAYEVAAWGTLVKLMPHPPHHLAGGRLKIESRS